MLPVIAIVGRPNVGKSTLFNCVTRSRQALVSDFSGLTRDRQYGEGEYKDQKFIVVDTGGIEEKTPGVAEHMLKQTRLAIEEANVIIFLVDAKAGLTASDEMFANELRKQEKPIYLIVNKIDGSDENVVTSEFYQLGLGEPIAIAAAHKRGVKKLIETILEDLPEAPEAEDEGDQGIKLAIVGKPNVGKSTLVNRILGEERVVVYDEPGTTRDSIFIPMERQGTKYTLIDTAGIRRRKNIYEAIEKFSVIKALQAIERANVIIMVVDARENISEHDLHLLGFILDAGKSLIIAFNKWDGLDDDQKTSVKMEIDRRLSFVNFAKVHFISALHGSGVGDLFRSINKAYESAMRKYTPSRLTRILETAVEQHPPPIVKKFRIKLRYAHAGGSNPPIVVIHGNQTKLLPKSYRRYLMNAFRDALKLVGTPVRLELKSSENPFKDKKQKLTPRQERKRQRLMKRVKK